ncbi:unnamed protein product [Fusarium fujikuroi]|uniref:Uncharacterized protein n=1 Tax=Fusarium fujikuroi TaxID=5127 RepID=A0A9Q9RW62_FUSFU|nr:unnamed protein product [Fusarium fujikuroi]
MTNDALLWRIQFCQRPKERAWYKSFLECVNQNCSFSIIRPRTSISQGGSWFIWEKRSKTTVKICHRGILTAARQTTTRKQTFPATSIRNLTASSTTPMWLDGTRNIGLCKAQIRQNMHTSVISQVPGIRVVGQVASRKLHPDTCRPVVQDTHQVGRLAVGA